MQSEDSEDYADFGWSADEPIERIGRELGSPVTPAEWHFLESEGDQALFNLGKRSPDEIAQKVRAARQVWGDAGTAEWEEPLTQAERNLPHPIMLPPGIPLPEDDADRAKQYAASRVLAARAATQEAVRAFRQDVLGDEWPSYQDIGKWVKRQAEMDGPPSYWLSAVPVEGAAIINAATEDGYTTIGPFRVPAPWNQRTHEPVLTRRFLEYYAFALRGPRRETIAAGGILGRLLHLAGDLAGLYRWQPAQAVTFIVTGMVPAVQAYSRVTLTVDPSLTVREVGELFQFAREYIVGKRGRPMSLKHLHLAVAAAEYDAGVPDRALMQEWNEAHPQWSYDHTGHFTHDANEAVKRLLREDGSDDSARAAMEAHLQRTGASSPPVPRQRRRRAPKPARSS